MELTAMTIRLPKVIAQKVKDLSKASQESLNETIIVLIQRALNDLNESTHTELAKQFPDSKNADSQ
jgi:hypothetical protein